MTVVFSRNALYMHFFKIGSLYTFSILELLKLPKIAQISTPVWLYCAFLVAWKITVIPAAVAESDKRSFHQQEKWLEELDIQKSENAAVAESASRSKIQLEEPD